MPGSPLRSNALNVCRPCWPECGGALGRALQVEKPGAGGAGRWVSGGLVSINLIHLNEGAVNGCAARARSSGRAETGGATQTCILDRGTPRIRIVGRSWGSLLSSDHPSAYQMVGRAGLEPAAMCSRAPVPGRPKKGPRPKNGLPLRPLTDSRATAWVKMPLGSGRRGEAKMLLILLRSARYFHVGQRRHKR